MMPTPPSDGVAVGESCDYPALRSRAVSRNAASHCRGRFLSASGFTAVGIGAALGAWLRWALAIWLNPVFPTIPLGTLSANLLGGFIIGGFLSVAGPCGFSPALRLLVVTGFLGGLTTFSTFSAETTILLLEARYGWALVAIVAHLLGSLGLTALGVVVVRDALAS